MEIVTEFAYKVREIEHCLIPLKDGKIGRAHV